MKLRRLKYIHEFRDRHGKPRHYFRRRGYPLTPLFGEPFSSEYMAVYERCLSGDKNVIGEKGIKARSINALVIEYYTTPEFRGHAEDTKNTYRRALERIREKYGDLPVATLERRNLIAIRNSATAAPTSANFTIRMFRMLLKLAVDLDWRRDNPAAGIDKIKVDSDGYHTWTEDEIKQYESFWATGTRERLAFDLLLCTAQRSGDVRLMGRQHLSKGFILVRQHKTKRKTKSSLSLPIHPQLRASLDLVPEGQMQFLVTAKGEPFTRGGFHNFVTDAIRAAGLPAGVPPHGLRKAASRRLAEAGCSVHQIASMTGHKSLKEIERYTREAEQKRLAKTAMAAQIVSSAQRQLEDDTEA